jgi:hypothetical protein
MPNRVFSLNHDLMIEIIAAKFGIPLHSGFSLETINLPRRNAFGAIEGYLKAEALTKHNLETGGMYYPNPPQRCMEPSTYLPLMMETIF